AIDLRVSSCEKPRAKIIIVEMQIERFMCVVQTCEGGVQPSAEPVVRLAMFLRYRAGCEPPRWSTVSSPVGRNRFHGRSDRGASPRRRRISDLTQYRASHAADVP